MVEFRLTDEEYQELSDYCINNNITIDEVVIKALQLYFDIQD